MDIVVDIVIAEYLLWNRFYDGVDISRFYKLLDDGPLKDACEGQDKIAVGVDFLPYITAAYGRKPRNQKMCSEVATSKVKVPAR